MAWKISPRYKKSISEVEIWHNGEGEELKHTTIWRWGAWIVPGDEKPNLDTYDPDVGMDPYDLADEVELDSMDDGDDYGFEYPASWKKKDIKKFEKLWESEWHEAPLMMGLVEDDTEYWISGPLDIEPFDGYASHSGDHDDDSDEGTASDTAAVRDSGAADNTFAELARLAAMTSEADKDK